MIGQVNLKTFQKSCQFFVEQIIVTNFVEIILTRSKRSQVWRKVAKRMRYFVDIYSFQFFLLFERTSASVYSSVAPQRDFIQNRASVA